MSYRGKNNSGFLSKGLALQPFTTRMGTVSAGRDGCRFVCYTSRQPQSPINRRDNTKMCVQELGRD
jgi:hypothetical protein